MGKQAAARTDKRQKKAAEKRAMEKNGKESPRKRNAGRGRNSRKGCQRPEIPEGRGVRRLASRKGNSRLYLENFIQKD